MVTKAPARASKIVIITTLLPTAFSELALKEQPIVKAIKPKAISLIQPIALIFVVELGSTFHPPINCPKTYGPKVMPEIRYPVTFGRRKSFISLEESRPTKRAMAMQRIWFIYLEASFVRFKFSSKHSTFGGFEVICRFSNF